MAVRITNVGLEAVALPYPLVGQLGPGKGVVVDRTKAQLLAAIPRAGAGYGLRFTELPGYTGPFDASYAPTSPVASADITSLAVNKLVPGTNGQVLTTAGGVAAWGAGASAPTGDGIPHIVGGVQQAAASPIVDADVGLAAALSVSKLAPAGTNGHLLATVAGVATWVADSAAALPTGCSTLAAVQDVAAAGLTSDLALAANAFVTLLRFTNGVGPSLDGVVSGGGAFRILIIRPSAASVQVVDHTTSASAAANRFETAVLLGSTGAGGIWAYDPTSLRWVNLGHQF